jgi:hypothetical protein
MSIREAIYNVIENNLDAMRQNFSNAITTKAVEKLEERKIEIAQNYFGQMDEAVEQIDELKRSTARSAEKKAKYMAANPHLEDDEDRPRATDRDSQWQNIRRMRVKKLSSGKKG